MADRKMQRDDRKIYGVYLQSVLTMKVIVPITSVGKNMKQNLERIISKKTEGKCIAEGFIRPNSVKVIRYSSGNINNENIEFQTVFECMICHPVEGMLIECDTKTITKAGIHAEVSDEQGNIPITVFVARDHHFTDRKFADIKENMKIIVRVVGVRFELNDPYICVIGKYIDRKTDEKKGDKKRGGESNIEGENVRLTIGGDDEFEPDDE
uniref:S1 motif domain-containing protein n=1 Tax=viral metagenome TaxID=1070528 RepID=A0A6C0LB59_9ZZZZ